MEVLYTAYSFLLPLSLRFQDHIFTWTRFLTYNRTIIIISGPATLWRKWRYILGAAGYLKWKWTPPISMSLMETTWLYSFWVDLHQSSRSTVLQRTLHRYILHTHKNMYSPTHTVHSLCECGSGGWNLVMLGNFTPLAAMGEKKP